MPLTASRVGHKLALVHVSVFLSARLYCPDFCLSRAIQLCLSDKSAEGPTDGSILVRERPACFEAAGYCRGPPRSCAGLRVGSEKRDLQQRFRRTAFA